MSVTDKIALFSAFGSWVSGIGTILAVIVSLYLANRKPQLKINCHQALIRRMYKTPEDKINFHFGLLIRVVNQSFVPVKIDEFSFSIKGGKHGYLAYSKILKREEPIRLDYSEERIIRLEDEDGSWIERLITFIDYHNAKPSDLLLAVHITTGKVFYFKLDEEIVKVMNDEIKFRLSS